MSLASHWILLMAEKTKSMFLDIFFILNMTWHHTDRSWSVWHLCYFLVLSCATVIEQHQPCPHCPRYSQPGSVSDACCIWGTEHMCFASILYLLRVVSCLSLLIYVLGRFPSSFQLSGKDQTSLESLLETRLRAIVEFLP